MQILNKLEVPIKIKYTDRMKNKELLNTAKIEFNNWLSGSNAGEFGIDDLLDVCYNLIEDFGDDAYNEIEMTLQSYVDDNIIDEDERAFITSGLTKITA